jgi:hypothetical protein
MYNVYVGDELKESFQNEKDAVLYCFENGYVTIGERLFFLKTYVRVEEEYGDESECS